jgi:hypothetical protein
MELQIINKYNQIIEIIRLENSNYIFCNKNPLTVNNVYIEFVYYLEKPVNNVIHNHPFSISDDNVLDDKVIKDCCKAITMLRPFLKKGYTININKV